MNLKVFSDHEMISILNNRNHWNKRHSLEKSFFKGEKNTQYYIMYSSLWGGFTKNPSMMLLPIDDHMVHRGDGVFETLICFDGAVFDLDSHLERLKESSALIGIQWPKNKNEVKKICVELLKASEIKKKSAILRIFISRGPGGFTADPEESIRSVLYMIVTRFLPLPESFYEKGVKAMSSQIPVKQSPFAKIKSCNYLHNVLMKREAREKNVDFSLGFTTESYLSEGSTENVALINQKNELLIPSFEYTLKGTTLLRVMDLAQVLIQEKILSNVQVTHILKSEVKKAKEMMLTGTTLGVLPLTEVDGVRIGDGLPGSVSKKLRLLLRQEMENHSKLRTVYC